MSTDPIGTGDWYVEPSGLPDFCEGNHDWVSEFGGGPGQVCADCYTRRRPRTPEQDSPRGDSPKSGAGQVLVDRADLAEVLCHGKDAASDVKGRLWDAVEGADQ